MSGRRVRMWVFAGLAVLAIGALGRALSRPRVIEVEAALAGTGAVEDVITNSEVGTVRSRAEARLSAERVGRVTEIRYREGARVPLGATLLRLDRSTATAQLDAARRQHEEVVAAHESAHANERLAVQQFERAQQLLAQKLIAQEQMDQARAGRDAAVSALRAAEARVLVARAAVQTAENELRHLEIRAPFAGVVTRRLVEVGESVTIGQRVLEMMSLDRLYVSAPIDERDAGRLAVGLPARVTLDPFPGSTWSGRVARVAPYVDETREQNRTIEAEVDLPRAAQLPTPAPGMSADVEIVLERRDSTLRVPSAAVVEGRRVLLIENGRARTREIVSGLRSWEWTEVRSGLRSGERVITTLDRPGLVAGVRVSTREAAHGGAAERSP